MKQYRKDKVYVKEARGRNNGKGAWIKGKRRFATETQRTQSLSVFIILI